MAENGKMRRQLGMSRRDLLRRGAVVGGTLLWTVPVVSTISRAHVTQRGSPLFVCCECTRPTPPSNQQRLCTADNPSVDSRPQCAEFCRDQGFRTSRFHTSSSPIACDDGRCAAH